MSSRPKKLSRSFARSSIKPSKSRMPGPPPVIPAKSTSARLGRTLCSRFSMFCAILIPRSLNRSSVRKIS
jgi:hypothetical protein